MNVQERLLAERETWERRAAQEARNAEYYRGLLNQVSVFLSPEVFVSDDGSLQDTALLAKIPELVARLAASSVTSSVTVVVKRHGG